jgi:hypothetical protein
MPLCRPGPQSGTGGPEHTEVLAIQLISNQQEAILAKVILARL